MRMNKILKPVIQQEATGCGIACAATLAGISYSKAKKLANSLGIFAQDCRLWSDTSAVRKLMRHLKINLAKNEKVFRGWDNLPDRALLAIKWHKEKGIPFWHWAVFLRQGGQACVLDSKKSLKKNIRTDFGRIQPKWFIEVYKQGF
jgi:ABC-type bacteriocin/lantibiotic exporter with double-glycine peptidase domain